MAAFLVRRIFQMVIVILLAAIVSYLLLYFTPGGPLLFLQQRQNDGKNRITQEDIARIRSYYELDLNMHVRFSRWLIGWPTGPLQLFGQQFGNNWEVGCAVPGKVRLVYPDGSNEIIEEGCDQPVTMADLEGRRSSRGILFGDLGRSQQIAKDQPIAALIASRLPYTLWLMGVSTLLAILIGVPIGIYSAVRQYSRFDFVMTTVTFVGASLPSFFFGILMILCFSILPKNAGLPYLPPGNAEAARDYFIPMIGVVQAGSLLDQVLHFIMPCAVLTFISIAGWSRFVRASMLEVLRLDYVRTARAKGVREQLVVMKHALRNALIPFITLLAGTLALLFAGAPITEAIFNWPGLGRLLLTALDTSDYPVAMALLFVSIVLLLIGYLIADILYTIVDPRIRVS